MQGIILASASPQRCALLKRAGVRFRAEASGYRENLRLKMSPRKLVEHLALGKARAAAARHKRGIVLGADTVVVLGERIFGKPKSISDGRATLRALSGKKHAVLTGIAIVDASTGRARAFSIATRVWFRALSPQEIAVYAKTPYSRQAAGAYALQSGGGAFVKKIRGDRDNVVGLPVRALVRELRKFSKENRVANVYPKI